MNKAYSDNSESFKLLTHIQEQRRIEKMRRGWHRWNLEKKDCVDFFNSSDNEKLFLAEKNGWIPGD